MTATAKRTVAEKNRKNKQIYDRFAGVAEQRKLRRCAQDVSQKFPRILVSSKSAKEDYDKIFPLFVESHLKNCVGCACS